MRVGLVVYGGLDNTSGGFRYDRRLVEGLRRRGDEVTVVELPWRSYGRHLLDNLPGRVDDRLRGSFDVLLQDELCHPSLVAPNRRLEADHPVVSVVHHLRSSEPRPAVRRALARRVEDAYLGGVDAVVCNSGPTLDAVRRLRRRPAVVAPPGRDHVAPAVDRERIRERADEQPFRVCFLGNVIPRKGVHTLIAALDRLDERWRATVVGSLEADPAYADRVRRLITDRGLGDRVELTGRLPGDEVVDRLAASHLLAVPSTHEGFGIVYLEGMAQGLPAVATAAGGASDLVTDGETGALVEPGDPGAVADAVRPLCRDRERLRRMSLAARDRYEAHPTWADTVDRIRGFLRELVDGETRGGRAAAGDREGGRA